MRYLALCTDYDGTIAHHGRVDPPTIAALEDLRASGRKLVLFFYPRADTPGCTREAMDFSRLGGDFRKAGTEVMGVSADPPAGLDRFKTKHRLDLTLLSDETHEMLRAYAVWGKKSMYGKTFLGVVRSTVLIGADGRIAGLWPKVKVDGHAAEVLKAAKAL